MVIHNNLRQVLNHLEPEITVRQRCVLLSSYDHTQQFKTSTKSLGPEIRERQRCVLLSSYDHTQQLKTSTKSTRT